MAPSADKRHNLSSAASKLLSTAVNSMVVRGLGPASSVVLTLLLARHFGAEITGMFYLLVTLQTCAAMIARFGFDTSLQRFVGAAAAREDWALVRGVYFQALALSTALSLVLALAMSLSSFWIADTLLHQPGQGSLVIWMSVAIIPFALAGLHAAMLKALGCPIWGGFIEAAALPVLNITLLAGYWLIKPEALVIRDIAVVLFISATVTVLLGRALLLRRMPTTANHRTMPATQLLQSCVPLLQVEILNYAILWLPMLLLGVFADSASAGQYSIAQRLAGQLGLIMLVFAGMTSARFAAHYQAGEFDRMSELASRTTRGLSLLAIPMALLLLVWPQGLLGLFGEGFIAADWVLRVLVVGQLVNLMTGPGGYLLAMSGQESALRNLLSMTALLTLTLSCWLIPAFGALGAAWAAAIAMILQNLACCLLVQRRLGLPFFLFLTPVYHRSRP